MRRSPLVSSQHIVDDIRVKRALDAKEDGTARARDDTCKPRPEPVKSGNGSGRKFVPWRARADLKCKE